MGQEFYQVPTTLVEGFVTQLQAAGLSVIKRHSTTDGDITITYYVVERGKVRLPVTAFVRPVAWENGLPTHFLRIAAPCKLWTFKSKARILFEEIEEILFSQGVRPIRFGKRE